MGKKVPKNVEEKMDMIGSFIEALIQDETDPSLVCAVFAGNLHKWGEDHGYDPAKLALAITVAIKYNQKEGD